MLPRATHEPARDNRIYLSLVTGLSTTAHNRLDVVGAREISTKTSETGAQDQKPPVNSTSIDWLTENKLDVERPGEGSLESLDKERPIKGSLGSSSKDISFSARRFDSIRKEHEPKQLPVAPTTQGLQPRQWKPSEDFGARRARSLALRNRRDYSEGGLPGLSKLPNIGSSTSADIEPSVDITSVDYLLYYGRKTLIAYLQNFGRVQVPKRRLQEPPFEVIYSFIPAWVPSSVYESYEQYIEASEKVTSARKQVNQARKQINEAEEQGDEVQKWFSQIEKNHNEAQYNEAQALKQYNEAKKQENEARKHRLFEFGRCIQHWLYTSDPTLDRSIREYQRKVTSPRFRPGSVPTERKLRAARFRYLVKSNEVVTNVFGLAPDQKKALDLYSGLWAAETAAFKRDTQPTIQDIQRAIDEAGYSFRSTQLALSKLPDHKVGKDQRSISQEVEDSIVVQAQYPKGDSSFNQFEQLLTGILELTYSVESNSKPDTMRLRPQQSIRVDANQEAEASTGYKQGTLVTPHDLEQQGHAALYRMSREPPRRKSWLSAATALKKASDKTTKTSQPPAPNQQPGGSRQFHTSANMELHKDAVVQPSKQSGGIPAPSHQYIRIATHPSHKSTTSPTLQPILIVLDLNGTLLFRSKTSSIRLRPYAEHLIHYLLSNFTVMIWSSARPHNVEKMCSKLFSPSDLTKLKGIWGRDRFGLTESDYNNRVQCYKRLTTVWDDNTINPPNQKFWNQENTILIDDSAIKAASEPYNILQIPEYVGQDEHPDTLKRVAEYLDLVKMQTNVCSYMRGNPFELGKNYA